MKRKIFTLLIPIILAGCAPKLLVKDSLFFSDKEQEAFFKNDCNPLLGTLVNKSDDQIIIQIYKKDNNSFKFLTEIILKPRFENNTVLEEGNVYLKYFLLPDYGTYLVSIIAIYKEIIGDQEAIFVNKKNQKFTITQENKCDSNLKIGWSFEIIN